VSDGHATTPRNLIIASVVAVVALAAGSAMSATVKNDFSSKATARKVFGPTRPTTNSR
jgi:hypothetical protein